MGNAMQKHTVSETIIVEGRYDKNTLLQFLDANIIETSGFGVFKSEETVGLIRRLALKTGVVILTDSDGAGFVIRNHIRSSVNEGRVLHAYIPEVAGKERRKRRPGAENLLGVEGMDAETVLKALRDAGATVDGTDAPVRNSGITKSDLFELGLTGAGGSAAARDELKKRLGLPQKLSTNALLEVLNALYSREEIYELAGRHKTE